MRILKTRHFAKWAKKQGIDKETFQAAAFDIQKGRYEVNLGGFLYKKRIKRDGTGKRGGFRVILFYRQEDKLVFIHGFAKNDKSTIDHDEEKAFKAMTRIFLSMTETQFDLAVQRGDFEEC